MTPNFTLVLSSDGIQLLHRTGAGWDLLGTADVQSATLAVELAALRQAAEARAPDGIRCALDLPEDQIKQLALKTPHQPETVRWQTARTALDGATPYPVDALAIDIAADGDLTHVAAVALETLEEAETFAKQHGFDPVRFTARLESGNHAWDADFGPAGTARAASDGAVAAPVRAEDQRTSQPAGQDTFGAGAQARKGSAMRHPAMVPVVVSVAAVLALGAYLAGWMGAEDIAAASKPPAVLVAAPASPVIPKPAPVETKTDAALITEARLSDEDAAVLDALAAPKPPTPPGTPPAVVPDSPPKDLSLDIWTRAPQVPTAPAVTPIEDIYVPAIDPPDAFFDAVALENLDTLERDRVFAAPPAPAPAGTRFDLDDRGLVIATPDGAVTPDGALVYEGPPPQTPPTVDRDVSPQDDGAGRNDAVAQVRPRARPDDLIETTERTNLGGQTLRELASVRPKIRPESAQEMAARASLVPLDGDDTAPAVTSGTAQAVASSLRPDARPRNFSQVVASSRARTAAAPPAQTARAAPRNAAPQIPSTASTARQATVRGALNLREVNLIGVYGKPSERRALVRLSNGRYERVKVGDRIDGGRISAIGDGELRYQKSGRSIVLRMPRG